MLNNVSLIGRLSAEPELKTTPNGTEVTRITLAVQRDYVAKGQERATDWIDCVAWRGNAKFICDYFHKGNLIAITGSIQTSTFEDKEGKKRKQTEVVINSAGFCERKSDKPAENVEVDGYSVSEEETQDLPF